MTNDEAKTLLFSGKPVQFKGIEYQRITAIIYRVVNGRVLVSAELLDKNNNSVTITDPKRVEAVVEGVKYHGA